jgi:hypothetical protein
MSLRKDIYVDCAMWLGSIAVALVFGAIVVELWRLL